MAYVGAIAAVAGAAVAAYSSVQQGKAAKEANDANAANAAREALAAKEKAAYDAETSQLQWQQLMGKQRALYAKAGVDLTSGSPLLMMSFEAEQAERDKNAILYEGKTAEESALSRANLFTKAGEDAEIASYYSAGSSFLSGLASTYKATNTTGTSSTYTGTTSSTSSTAKTYSKFLNATY